jgi:dipeptidyl aminopeptidase/acylaminoacyl peptidase
MNIQTFLKIKLPSLVVWSPDGRKIAYVVGGNARKRDIMVSSIPEGNSRCIVSDLPPLHINKDRQDVRWGKDGKLIFNSKHSYFTVSIEDGKTETLPSGHLLGERVQLSPDEKNISFVRDGDLWVKPVAGGEPRSLTEGEGHKRSTLNSERTRCGEGDKPWLLSYHLPQWSPDSSKIVFCTPSRGASSNLGVVSLENGEISWIGPTIDMETNPVWSPNSKMIAFTRLSWDYKKRELLVSQASGVDVRRVWLDTDDRWVARADSPTSWSHDGTKISFVSNKSGWNHLYCSQLDGEEPNKVTEGEYEVSEGLGKGGFQWSPDDSEIAFISNRDSLQESSVWIVSSAGGEARRLVNMRGVCNDFQWSPDGKYISFIHTGPFQMPGLWIVEASGESEPVQIYNSFPEGMSEKNLADIKPVEYKSMDGTIVHAVLLTPKDLKSDEKYPVVIYMYGFRGQNSVLGFNNLYMNYLVQRGYIVLIVDPRGSAGYGKEYETANHLDPGGKHAEDVASGAKYLSTLDYVNPDRIGITGGSAGGYMTLMNLIRFPEVYAAGVAWVGMFDITYHYEYHIRVLTGMRWVEPRFGMPAQQPYIYQDRDPLLHVNQIKAPLLLFAGTEDLNVPFQDHLKMVTALVNAGKEFEQMIYPGEPHHWSSIESYTDSIKRINWFFDRHLKQQ